MGTFISVTLIVSRFLPLTHSLSLVSSPRLLKRSDMSKLKCLKLTLKFKLAVCLCFNEFVFMGEL